MHLQNTSGHSGHSHPRRFFWHPRHFCSSVGNGTRGHEQLHPLQVAQRQIKPFLSFTLASGVIGHKSELHLLWRHLCRLAVVGKMIAMQMIAAKITIVFIIK